MTTIAILFGLRRYPLWMATLFMLAFSSLLFSATMAGAEDKPLPTHLNKCVNEAIAELVVIDGSEESVRKIFFKYADVNWLGSTAYKNAWKGESKKWRTVAINLYLSMLITKGKEAVGEKTVKKIHSRLADYPERGGDGTNGYWHIAFSAILSNGQHVAAAALVTDDCKFIDLNPGAWISRFVSASEVDAIIRQLKKES